MNRQERLEALANAVIPEAIEWVRELRAYRTYQGKDPEYFRKARVGLGPRNHQAETGFSKVPVISLTPN